MLLARPTPKAQPPPPLPPSIEDLSHQIGNQKKTPVLSMNSDSDSSDNESNISLLDEAKKHSPRKKKNNTSRPITPPKPSIPVPPPPQIKVVSTKSLTSKPAPPSKTQDVSPLHESHQELITKLNEYQNRLPKLFSNDEKTRWNHGENNLKEDQARALYRALKSRIASQRKTIVINAIYDKFSDLSEEGMVNLLSMGDMVGFSKFAKDNRAYLEDELNEIACEMSDAWLPGPKTRLALGFMNLMEEFKKKKSQGVDPNKK